MLFGLGLIYNAWRGSAVGKKMENVEGGGGESEKEDRKCGNSLCCGVWAEKRLP